MRQNIDLLHIAPLSAVLVDVVNLPDCDRCIELEVPVSHTLPIDGSRYWSHCLRLGHGNA